MVDYKYLQYRNIVQNRYIIYTDGRIYDEKLGKFKKPFIIYPKKNETDFYDSGYYFVGLSTNLPNGKHKSQMYAIHRLVATMFIPNPSDLPQVNHKDGNKLNPDVSNLEWCTAKDNNIHAVNTGLRPVGENASYATCTNEQIHTICKLLQENIYTNKEIGNIVGVKEYIVKNVKTGRQWKHIVKNYKFVKKQNRITETKAREICEYLELGFTVKEVSKLLNITIKTVLNIRDGNTWKDISIEYNFPREKPHITENEAIQICKYLEDKIPVKDISKLTNISTNVIYKIRNRTSWVNISSDYIF